MNAQDGEPGRENVPTRPAVVRLLTRDGQKLQTDVKPLPPREEEHPADEPGYGHGV